jgi:hypothetical protein
MALKALEPSEKGVSIVDTRGGKQQVATVTESGLYALILASRRPDARRFRVWVTSVVLPSVARTGGYGAVAQQQPQIEGLVEPRFFAASGWEARTAPMRMCEFLRSIGVPDEAVEAEAPVRERELRLASLGTGRVSGFFRLGTDAWVFHRSVLDAWWAAAGREVVASIRSRALEVPPPV